MTPSAADLAFVAILGVAWPLYDHFVEWPMFMRWLKAGRRRARRIEYGMTLVKEWSLVAVGAMLWLRAGRPLSALGLVGAVGWRLWVSAAAVSLLAAAYASPAIKVARSAKARAHLRKVLASVESILPHTHAEFAWFLALSVTAGICEEFLFRGYFTNALSPWLGWWGAAGLSVLAFGLVHAYQGMKGIVRTGVVGAIMTLVVAATRSLLPAMALHAVIDMGSGVVAWLALKEPAPEGSSIESPA